MVMSYDGDKRLKRNCRNLGVNWSGLMPQPMLVSQIDYMWDQRGDYPITCTLIRARTVVGRAHRLKDSCKWLWPRGNAIWPSLDGCHLSLQAQGPFQGVLAEGELCLAEPNRLCGPNWPCGRGFIAFGPGHALCRPSGLLHPLRT